jgi:DNA-binding ferritin-like protein
MIPVASKEKLKRKIADLAAAEVKIDQLIEEYNRMVSQAEDIIQEAIDESHDTDGEDLTEEQQEETDKWDRCELGEVEEVDFCNNVRDLRELIDEEE